MKLADVAKLLVVAEEFARKVSGEKVEIKKPEKVVIEEEDKYTSRFLTFENRKLPFTLLSVSGSGAVDEVVVLSSSEDYGVEVNVDGYINTFWFNKISGVSTYSSNVTAFTDTDGMHVMRLVGIDFSKYVRIRVVSSSRDVYLNTALIRFHLVPK